MEPPIQPTPGDLLMIFQTATTALEAIWIRDPNDHAAIQAAAETTKVALDHWLTLAARKSPSAPGEET